MGRPEIVWCLPQSPLPGFCYAHPDSSGNNGDVDINVIMFKEDSKRLLGSDCLQPTGSPISDAGNGEEFLDI